eukprot:665281-Pelagomonas_calceolata.AAC.2
MGRCAMLCDTLRAYAHMLTCRAAARLGGGVMWGCGMVAAPGALVCACVWAMEGCDAPGGGAAAAGGVAACPSMCAACCCCCCQVLAVATAAVG